MIIALVALVAACAHAIPIKVHEEVQYAAPQHHEQLVHYVPHVQYSHEPQHHLQVEHEVEEHHHAHPKYEFKYGVKDTHTHDIKEQAEKRDGHKVEGYYKLVEPDGTTRTVHYTADKHTGFHAQNSEKSGKLRQNFGLDNWHNDVRNGLVTLHLLEYDSPALSLVAMLAAAALAVPVYEEHQHVEEEHYFKYAVKDEHTQDIKEQYEKRDGDKVEGYYSLVEPDGTIRTVKYSSDKHTGFVAHVEKSGHASHPAPIKKVEIPVKKVIYPVKKVVLPVKKVVYPVKYHSYEPVVQHSYTQEPSHYEAPSYSDHSSEGSASYSSISLGGGSEGYGHAQ
ncbi:hypothetical protein C0J52_10420 [Blattella germanica]|nr:hypothetical protein C0J52_10420 [Blattella germanica]